MEPLTLGFAGIGVALVLMAARVPVAVALGAVSIAGIALLRGPGAALGALGTLPFDFAANWSLSAVPMFLLMGAICHHTGLTSSLYDAARLWLNRLPGGLAVASNFAAALFAAASGSSLATAAAMGRIAIPEMLRHGYDKALATGTVAAAGTLGALIPPSILFVVYGWFTEQSIGKLLIAGILPGLLTAVVYALMIIGRCVAQPRLAPSATISATRRERWRATRRTWPLPVLILGVIGSIYGGIATPTEAGALGALLAALIAAAQRRLTFRALLESVGEATRTTAVILFVALGAVLLTRFLTMAGVPRFLAAQVGAFAIEPLQLVLVLAVTCMILGMFLSPLGLMLITLPVFVPMFNAANVDLIWIGVLVVKFIEIGLLTPPVGLNVYVVKGVVGDAVPLGTIFRGIVWFLACDVLVIALIIGFPGIALYLPSLMD